MWKWLGSWIRILIAMKTYADLELCGVGVFFCCTLIGNPICEGHVFCYAAACEVDVLHLRSRKAVGLRPVAQGC